MHLSRQVTVKRVAAFVIQECINLMQEGYKKEIISFHPCSFTCQQMCGIIRHIYPNMQGLV